MASHGFCRSFIDKKYQVPYMQVDEVMTSVFVMNDKLTIGVWFILCVFSGIFGIATPQSLRTPRPSSVSITFPVLMS